MVWIFLQELEELPLHSESGLTQLHIAKLNHSAKASFCKECKKAICPKHQFGMILEVCQKIELKKYLMGISTSSQQGFRAKTSASLDLEKAWKESEADFFSISFAWPKRSSPNSYSLKMSQPSAAVVDFWPLEKLPPWGMTVDGVLYPLRPLEHCILEKDGSCLLATPRASQAAKLIRKQTDHEQKTHGEALTDSIGRLSPELIGKKLSPMFVEVLMGYKMEWTDLSA